MNDERCDAPVTAPAPRDRRLTATILSVLLPVALAGGLGAGLGGCNTVEGVGEDVEAGGEALDDAADD